MWAVQQVYQSYGWWGEGNPHSGTWALEEMHRPYVHTALKLNKCLPHIGLITLGYNYCLHTVDKILRIMDLLLSLCSFFLILSSAKRVPENWQSLPKPLLCLHQQWIPRYTNMTLNVIYLSINLERLRHFPTCRYLPGIHSLWLQLQAISVMRDRFQSLW